MANKLALKQKQIWAIRIRLEISGNIKDSGTSISYFDIDNNQIEIKLSRFPRMVSIYVNNALISKYWMFRKNSSHQLQINGKSAEIIIDIDRWISPKKTTSYLYVITLFFIGILVGLAFMDFLIEVYKGLTQTTTGLKD